MGWRPHPKRASVDPMRPSAWATDDRTGFITNLRDLVWQDEWSGPQLINTQVLTHPDFRDTPNPQFRSIVLPPDPPPIFNTRPEPYDIDETTFFVSQDGVSLVAQDGKFLVPQSD